MVPARRSSAAPALLRLIMALLACTAAAADGGATICDTADCGKGSCSEAPGFIPGTVSYNCTCDHGWAKAIDLPISPCTVPKCHFDASCFNITLAPPRGIPITDPCVAINCGPGECKKGEGFTYRCECQPGYVNLLNLTAFPCVKNCFFGMDCSTLGIGPPPPSPAPSPAPPSGNHDTSGPTAPPSATKGNATTASCTPCSVSSQSLLRRLLLLVSLAMALHVV
ncbi:hypothetical protein ACP70R_019278 [Stipagrostis hirtigluma subsp. patula]